MNPSNSLNEPARDPRRAHLRLETGSAQQTNGVMSGDSPQQPSQASPASTSMSLDSSVGIRIRGTAKHTDSKDDNKAFDDFANHIASFSTTAIRREQATRKSKVKRSELRKTEEKSSQFPSLLNQSHRRQKAAGEELATVDLKLQEHMKVRNELIQAISGGASSNSGHQEELEGMRAELEKTKLEMKEEVARARQEAAQAREENERMKLEIRRVDHIVSEAHLSRIIAVETETSRTESQLKSTSQKMDDLLKSVDQAHVVSQSLKDEIDTFKTNIQSTHAKLGQQVDSFKSKIDSNQEQSASISGINDTLCQHKSLFDNLKAELEKVEKVTSTAAAAKDDVTKKNASLEAITDDIQNLSKQIEDLWKYLELKDEEVVKDSEQRGKAIESVTGQLKQVRDDLDQLAKQSKQKQDEQARINAASAASTASQSDPLVTSLKQDVEKHTKLLTNNCHAIQSLELRYNNITTDAIVRDMVREMQVMYPYASTAQDAIEKMKAEVGDLSRKYPSDMENVNNRVIQLWKDFETLRNDQKILFSGAAEQQTKSIEAIAHQVRDVSDKNDKNTSKLEVLDAAHATSEKERRSMIQTMNHERDRIMEKFSSVATTETSQQKQEKMSRKLDCINTKLRDVETTTAEDVGKLDARVEVLENKVIEHIDTPASRPSSESSGEVPLALAATMKPSTPGRPPSRPSLLAPSNKPKMSMGSVKPLKRKTPGSSSSTPQTSKNNDRGTPKPKKLKGKH